MATSSIWVLNDRFHFPFLFRMQELREKQRKHLKEAKKAEEAKTEQNIKVNSSTSHVMESENQPQFSPTAKPAKEEVESGGGGADLLIQRQSKDETVVQVAAAVKEQPPQQPAVGDLSEYQEAAAAAAVPKQPSLMEKFSDIIETLLVPDQPFDLERFKAKVRADRETSKETVHFNESWLSDHSVLSCPAKPFLDRFSVQGEIFDT